MRTTALIIGIAVGILTGFALKTWWAGVWWGIVARQIVIGIAKGLTPNDKADETGPDKNDEKNGV